MDGIKRLWPGLVDLWCSWTHGGGWIMRDPSGKVNWQCKKCGRWAEPVEGSSRRAKPNDEPNAPEFLK